MNQNILYKITAAIDSSHINEFLNTVREDFDYVLHVDPADVIIQNDPFLFFKEHPSKELFLVS